MTSQMELNGKCPIWATPANIESREAADGRVGPFWASGFNVNSQRTGGRYSIDRQASDKVGSSDFDVNAKARITTWLVNERRFGNDQPKITIDILDRSKAYPALSVYERADRLLRYVAEQSPVIGGIYHFYPGIVSAPNDPKLELLAHTESTSESEISYLLDYLESEKLLAVGPSKQVGRRDLFVSPKGYSRIAEVERKEPLALKGFVAMWFDPSMDEIYSNGFESGIEAAGYRALRIDRKDHNNKIDDEIIAEVRRSRFLVADFTHGKGGPRGGVYYEAGFAQGLGIPVIYTCRKDQIKKLHFDTRQFNHIDWTTAEELSARLAARISATIGDGPLKASEAI